MPNELKETHISNIADLKETGFGYTLSVIGGKYKIIIFYWLLENEVMRFNELKRRILNISYKTLSVTLKEMEADKIVLRKEFPQIPPSLRKFHKLPMTNLMESSFSEIKALYDTFDELKKEAKISTPDLDDLQKRSTSKYRNEVNL